MLFITLQLTQKGIVAFVLFSNIELHYSVSNIIFFIQKPLNYGNINRSKIYDNSLAKVNKAVMLCDTN